MIRLRARGYGLGNQARGHCPKPLALSPQRIRGQASLEMGLAMMGALLLLYGSLKVCLWLVDRVVDRQVAYDKSRVSAGSDASPGAWNDPTKADAAKLKMFQ